MPSRKRVRFAVIGCGCVGPVHADAVARCPEAELVAVCDVILERAERCAERFGGRAYEDCALMLEAGDLDAASVCTPHYNHAEVATGCLRAGVHVLCEKPLAISVAQMDAMLRAARETGRTLGGVFQHRFDPVAVRTKQAVDAGRLGRILNTGCRVRCHRGLDYYDSAEWRGTLAGEGGAVLINQAIHSVDMVQWIAGPVRRVLGFCANLALRDRPEVEDTVGAAVEFACGALGTIEATGSSHLDFDAVVDLHGTEGSVSLATGGETELTSVRMCSADAEQELRAALTSGPRPARSDVAKGYYGYSHVAQLADFVRAVRDGRAPSITGEDARRAAEVVLAVYESSRTGRAADLPLRTSEPHEG